MTTKIEELKSLGNQYFEFTRDEDGKCTIIASKAGRFHVGEIFPDKNQVTIYERRVIEPMSCHEYGFGDTTYQEGHVYELDQIKIER